MSDESTTPDLEELSRRAIDALNRRDFDGLFAMWAPNIVWATTPVGTLLGGTFEGRDAVRGATEDWSGPYEDWYQEFEEFRDLGSGVGFAVLHQRGRLPVSTGVVELRFANVITSVDGLIQRVTTYTDIDQARVAPERLTEEQDG